MKHGRLWLFLCFAILALTGGCGHYRLGSGTEPPFSSICIAPVLNDSSAPQVQALLWENIREAFLRGGSVALAPETGAGAVLEAVLTNYQRDPSVSRRDDTGLAAGFDISLSAQITLTDASSGEVYIKDRVCAATRRLYAGDNLPQAEHQNMPLLTRDLAQKIKDAVLQVW